MEHNPQDASMEEEINATRELKPLPPIKKIDGPVAQRGVSEEIKT